jgi:copper chaperone CopZ
MFRALLVIVAVICMSACDRPVQPAATPVTTPTVLVVDIEGMHCTACAASIAATVGDCEGVRSADVSFENANATITADDANALERAMQTARNMGYTVEPVVDDES